MRYRCVFALLITAGLASAKHDVVERVQSAKTVFEEIMASPDKSIPRDLLEKAHCIVIVPSLKRGGFIVGAQYGVGVATCRQADGTGWTGPSTVRMEGGSLGLQIGGGETDVVMMVMNATGAQKLMRSEFTVGAEGAAMAGPVGRSATAETDAYMRAEILSYSRSRGVFAGVAVKGSTLRSDDADNKVLYGHAVTHADVLNGREKTPAAARPLLAAISRYSIVEKKSEVHPRNHSRVPLVNAAYFAESRSGSDRSQSRIMREVRHELVTLPYYGVFDNLLFKVEGSTVTLMGQVARPTLKSSAENVVKNIEGVERVVNQIEVLPNSPNDDRIRIAVYRSVYGQTALNRYAMQAVPPIHIVVKNGNVSLEGVVATEADKNIANMQANAVSGVFSVKNNLRVEAEK
jgi:lipid-binding SYLF domain-containing protein/osmotically-inducible protein OsmY